jgi:hypothetical protein
MKSIQVQNKANPVASRAFALRFALSVPRPLVETVLSSWNGVLEEKFPDQKIFFSPDLVAKEEFNGEEVLVAHLFADEQGWHEYQNRGESLAPYADAKHQDAVVTKPFRPVSVVFPAPARVQ